MAADCSTIPMSRMGWFGKWTRLAFLKWGRHKHLVIFSNHTAGVWSGFMGSDVPILNAVARLCHPSLCCVPKYAGVAAYRSLGCCMAWVCGVFDLHQSMDWDGVQAVVGMLWCQPKHTHT